MSDHSFWDFVEGRHFIAMTRRANGKLLKFRAEEWHVLLQGCIYSTHESEMEAVSRAKDILYDLRVAAQDRPWDPAVESLAISKVLYEVRITDNDPEARRCDFQLFPCESEA